MEYLNAILSSQLLAALLSGLMVGAFSLMATRRQTKASRALERHRFRYEIGRLAAEKRLDAYTVLASRVTAAYRAKTTTDWANEEWVAPLNESKNYYYDHRFFFSRALGDAFRRISGSLGHEAPNRERLEKNLNAFFDVVREDLLLGDLEDSVARAIKAAVDHSATA